MENPLLELYSDYLLSSFGQTTATGMSRLVDDALSHDQVTRFLAGAELKSQDLWRLVKKPLRAIESDDGVLIFDDTIEEKPYSDENEIIAWHFDHCQNRTVKGVNILNCLYHSGEVNIPVAFEIVHKDLVYCEVETRQVKRRSAVTQNEHLRAMLGVCRQNQVRYRYVLTDNWFSSKENMAFIKVDLGKDFVMSPQKQPHRRPEPGIPAPRLFRPHGRAPAGSQHRPVGLPQGDSVPRDAGQASLYEQGRQHRCPVSGVE